MIKTENEFFYNPATEIPQTEMKKTLDNALLIL